ncbi:MAG: hypothetical protein AAGK14_02585 [Verrucomicrobiota bacterium]
MDKTDTFHTSRVFSIWDTLVTSNQLLLRSYADRDNLDLIFNGVFYLELPFDLKGIRLAKPNAAELKRLQKRSQRNPQGSEQFYVLVSQGRRYYVGAKSLVIEHNSQSSVDPFFFTAKYLYESQQEDFYRANVDRSEEYLSR